jgi:hypothetical protein
MAEGYRGGPERRESRRSPERGDEGRFEHQPALNPRDILANSLEGQTRGSIKVQALADWTTLEAAKEKLSYLQGLANPHPDAFIVVRAEKAAVEETIRTKKFSEDSKEYKAAFGGGEAWGAYVDQRWQEGGTGPQVRSDAANRLLKDLEELNDQLPKKGEAKPQNSGRPTR